MFFYKEAMAGFIDWNLCLISLSGLNINNRLWLNVETSMKLVRDQVGWSSPCWIGDNASRYRLVLCAT